MKFGILLFDGVEPIDLAALGALSIARRFEPTIETCVISTGEHNKVTLACNVKIDAEFTIKDAPECDVYLIAGGPTWKEEIHREQTLEFIRSKSLSAILGAACMGVTLLAAAGVLDNKKATLRNQTSGTEENPIEYVKRQWPAIDPVVAHIVDQGRIVTGGGGVLNLDVALYLLERLYSRTLARNTGRILEYNEAYMANANRLGILKEQ